MINNTAQELKPKKSTWKWLRWVLLALAAILVTAVVFFFGIMHITITPFDGENPPQFIQADFVELDKVYAISKFRSGVGHDFSVSSGETCRSMKHYFSTIDATKPNYKIDKGLNLADWPAPVEGYDATIFSPVDGTIAIISRQPEKGLMGDEIVVVPDAYKSIRIRLMHVTPISEDIKAGTKVTAGQKIGLVHANQSFDIAIESVSIFKTSYISYFAAMPDEIFAKYQARGVESREDFIFTKEEIDANSWECVPGSEEFVENYAGTPETAAYNMVYLSGYEEIEEQVEAQWNDLR